MTREDRLGGRPDEPSCPTRNILHDLGGIPVKIIHDFLQDSLMNLPDFLMFLACFLQEPYMTQALRMFMARSYVILQDHSRILHDLVGT